MRHEATRARLSLSCIRPIFILEWVRRSQKRGLPLLQNPTRVSSDSPQSHHTASPDHKTPSRKMPSPESHKISSDEILNHLVADSGSQSLVSRSWIRSPQRYLFHTIKITPKNVNGWLRRFPAPEESPARHIRDLRVLIGDWRSLIPDEFFRMYSVVYKRGYVVLLGGREVSTVAGALALEAT